MTLRIIQAPEEIVGYLVATSYPHEWLPSFLETCLTLEVRVGEEVAGYLWFSHETEDSLQIHAAIGRGFRHKWVTSDDVVHLTSLLILLGVDKVLAQHQNNPAMKRLLRSFGFSEDTGEELVANVEKTRRWALSRSPK